MGENGSLSLFIVISDQPYYFGCPEEITKLKVTLIRPSPYPSEILTKVRDTVDDYIKRVLEDYHDLGLMISFEKAHPPRWRRPVRRRDHGLAKQRRVW